MKTNRVVLFKAQKAEYPINKNFRPTCRFPETPFLEVSSQSNYVYEAVRNAFYKMGYDTENFNKSTWNPLKEIVHPGDTVLVKPNLVMHVNPTGDGEECLYTQVSVVAAVLDYIIIALQGKGKITVADAPMQACDFDELVNNSGYKAMIEYYQERLSGIEISLKDLRGIKSKVRNGCYYYNDNLESKQVIVKLNDDSEFFGLSPKQMQAMRVTNYDPDILNSHHNSDVHEYAIAEDVLEADVIINMPKCKTHRKAGVTASLKNMVGVCARKEYLPHHTNGAKLDDEIKRGDAYLSPTIFRRIEDFLLDWKNRFSQTRKKPLIAFVLQVFIRINNFLSHILSMGKDEKFSEGSWYGNTTISKTITDLNKIIFFANKKGDISSGKKRRYLIVADMIIAGDKEGPLLPNANPIGLIGVGENPVIFDEVIATIYRAKMDYMHTIKQARKTADSKYPLVQNEEIGVIVSNNSFWNNKTWKEISENALLDIRPTSGWKKAFK